MACHITITSVVGHGPPGGTASSVTVSGTAEDCKTIEVRLTCSPGGTATGSAGVDPSGNWTVDLINTRCQCGETVEVVARCVDDPACMDVFAGSLECQPD